jgi:hypothetical protein
MNTITLKTLERLDATYGQRSHTSTKKRLKVFYGWSKINKIQKREAIAIAFENSEGAGWENSRSGKSIRKTMTICYERYQTDDEIKDADFYNRVFTVYNVFLDDKHIGGSLKKALADNSEKDKNHVSEKERKRISQSLEIAFIAAHPGYQKPTRELELPFTPDK